MHWLGVAPKARAVYFVAHRSTSAALLAKLPFDALDVGRIWDRRVEIDIVAFDRRSRTALLGECRWRRGKVGVEVLDGLTARAAQLEKLEGYKLHYMLFSRAGFTAALEARAKRERVRLVTGVPGDAHATRWRSRKRRRS